MTEFVYLTPIKPKICLLCLYKSSNLRDIMQNIYWYLALAIISLGAIGFIIFHKRNTYKASTLLVFVLFSACFTWIGEFIVLGLFDAYAYKTGVFENPWAQNLLGHLLINTTLYPAAAIVLVTYQLRYRWVLLTAGFFTLIEYGFVQLRIYEQHWWRYYMTFLAVTFFLSVYRKWFSAMNQKRYGLVRAATFYFVAMLIIHAPAPILLLLGKQHYQMSFVNNLFGDLYLSSIIVIFFYHLFEALLLVLCTCVLRRWYWSLLPIIISIAAQTIFAKLNILIIEQGWSLIYTIVIYLLFIVIYVLVEKTTLKSYEYRPRI